MYATHQIHNQYQSRNVLPVIGNLSAAIAQLHEWASRRNAPVYGEIDGDNDAYDALVIVNGQPIQFMIEKE